MEKANISYLFYKQYFKEIDFSFLLEKDGKGKKDLLTRNNKALLDSKLYCIPPVTNEPHTITAKAQYPGLVTGIGINHEASIEGEFKLGVHFDYTYGMPVIYGSSVKGALRSAFKDKPKYVASLLKDSNVNVSVENLEKAVFDGKIDNKNLSIYERDIFFDAVIVQANKSKGRILESDSITPHGDNPLKNPIPLTFMKIASGVTMEFRFDLKKSMIGQVEVTPGQKIKLFKTILEDLGIGAKTNVGYGQFEPIS